MEERKSRVPTATILLHAPLVCHEHSRVDLVGTGSGAPRYR